MKSRVFLAALAAILLTGCSPEIYRMYMDVRQPSSSGLMLGGKTMAVVYMDGPTKGDSLMQAATAQRLATILDKDYFNGEEAVGVFSIPYREEVTMDDMHSLVMDTEQDVVILMTSSFGEVKPLGNTPAKIFSSVDSSYVFNASVPFSIKLYAYDSMGKDEVKSYTGSTDIRHQVYNSGIVPEENLKDLVIRETPNESAAKVAGLIGSRFTSGWKTETFSFYWFDDWDVDVWFDAIDLAEEGKYSKAIDKWSRLVKGKNEMKAAHACYNIAMAFYLMGDMELAGKWLDVATASEEISLAPGLRQRIANHLEK